MTIGQHTFRSSVAPTNGTYMLGLNADVRQQTGIAGADVIELESPLDTEPLEVAVPADFSAALGQEPQARKFFDQLSYSNRSTHVLSIEGAKTDATRRRRIEKSVATLASGNVR